MTTPRGRLRVIRENAQAIQRSIARLRGPDEMFKARFPAEQRLWEQNAGDIDRDLEVLATQLEANEVKAEIDDEVEFVRNAWGEAKEAWRALVEHQDEEAARPEPLDELDARLATMVLKIGFLAIPARVAEFVSRERAGGAFHFHAAFQNELPRLEDRVALLEYLKESPGGLYGIVDVKRGIVWAVARNTWGRSRGYVSFLVVLILGAVTAWFSKDLASVVGLGNAVPAPSDVFRTYVLIALGMLAHIGLDLYKQRRHEDPDSPTAVEDLILWGHVQETQVILTAFSVWIGTALLVGFMNPVEPATALLAGYSLDSVLDALLQRFETAASKGVKDLTDKVAGATATT
jgi:hypothetical protein